LLSIHATKPVHFVDFQNEKSSKMNIIRSIITKPLLTLFCIIATLGLSLIAFSYEAFIGALGLVLVAIIIMIAPVVYTIRLKKWDRLVVYLLIYAFLPVFCLIALTPVLAPGPMIVDKKFYNEHFESHSSLQNIKLNVYCKQDTIFGIGPGGSDFSAVCIFRVNKNQVKKIENRFRNDTSFVKLEISKFEYIIKESKDLNCSENIKYGKYGYKSMIRSDLESSFVFSKDKNYLLFYIDSW
jgi:hypothetical protein